MQRRESSGPKVVISEKKGPKGIFFGVADILQDSMIRIMFNNNIHGAVDDLEG